ncbi:hypothetical protein QV01_06465 [Gallibacterium genomosp. 3]|uniref:Uncharacterized protein n=1 Tax=Gallibacterium genomosp. 3 TaxID=505345 RepID=A0A1A7NQK7_9PAST|nr:hypothetical protein QV01_06465 [Gallibacterium genomosp. 3]
MLIILASSFAISILWIVSFIVTLRIFDFLIPQRYENLKSKVIFVVMFIIIITSADYAFSFL